MTAEYWGGPYCGKVSHAVPEHDGAIRMAPQAPEGHYVLVTYPLHGEYAPVRRWVWWNRSWITSGEGAE